MLNTVTEQTPRRVRSLQSAAAKLEVSVPFLRKQIKLGTLRAKKVSRRVLILDQDLQEFLDNSPYCEAKN